MAADITHKKEQAVAGVAGEVNNVACDERHRLPKVGDVDVFDVRHAAGDHHALHVFGALVVGAHDLVLLAQALFTVSEFFLCMFLAGHVARDADDACELARAEVKGCPSSRRPKWCACLPKSLFRAC